MIAKKYKINKTDFEKIKENTLFQKRVIFGNFVVFKKKWEKYGIIISKKVVKTANIRNKYKRAYFNFIKENTEKTAPNLLYIQNVTTLKNFKEDLVKEMTKVVLEYKDK